MFLEEYPKQTKPPVFENEQYAKITRLSHSYNNPNWSYQYHLHKNETEFIYIAGGKGTFSINTNLYHVTKGDILIVEKGAIHSLISDKDAPLDCWTCAAYDYKLCDRIYVGFMLPANVCPHMKAGIHEPLIQSIFHELDLLRTFPSNTRISTSDLLGTALVNIYYEIFRENPMMERRKDSSFAQNILIYINENYDKKITLKLLSEHFHISADYISHEFRKIYGISPINYVIDRRLNDAKWLLINTLYLFLKRLVMKILVIFLNYSKNEFIIHLLNFVKNIRNSQYFVQPKKKHVILSYMLLFYNLFYFT